MRGHVPTPDGIVDLMVSQLFEGREPTPDDMVLDPGCGDGPFIAGVRRYCEGRGICAPRIIGVELDPVHADVARERFSDDPTVEILCEDFLEHNGPAADFVIGNPPYVSILQLDEAEKRRFRARFTSAAGRFDLYMLFFEKALALLKRGGRLAFVTPEKFAYVATAAPLRKIIARQQVRRLTFLGEKTFPGYTTYPLVTVLDKTPSTRCDEVDVVCRDGSRETWFLVRDGNPWSNDHSTTEGDTVPLASLCIRISCGIATGADGIFVRKRTDISPDVGPFCYPTISGRQLGTQVASGAPVAPQGDDVMIIPYDVKGTLLPQSQIIPIRRVLSDEDVRRLEARSCVQAGGRVWYRFHDNVPLSDILRPKILCKDITKMASFWVDSEGTIVPRHSVYYLVPNPEVDIEVLAAYLNTDTVRTWLATHCHKAANGFLRVQSTVLKRLPVPSDLFPSVPTHGIATPSGDQTTILQFN